MTLTLEEEKQISALSERLFNVLGPDKQLAFNFFAVFSRFEYALKRAKYLKPDYYGNAFAIGINLLNILNQILIEWLQ